MKKTNKKELRKRIKGVSQALIKRYFVSPFILLALVFSPLSAKGKPEIYIGGLGTLTAAQNVGYNKDAPGIEANLTSITDRIGFNLTGNYSSSRKVKTNRGYSSGLTLKAFYRVYGKLFISSGVQMRYYTTRSWEKKAYFLIIGLKYGLPKDLFQFHIYHSFKEHQTTSECAITSVELTSTIYSGKLFGIQLRSSTHIIRYDLGHSRKTGVTGEIGIGFLFSVVRKNKHL